MNIQEVHRYLENYHINPSVQRSAIMQYLLQNFTHPTVDQIYADLLPDMPTLSKATVYNTLKLFVDKKAVKAIYIDERNVRYDAQTGLHAHFKCRRCNDIYEVPLEESDIPTFRGGPELRLGETQIYFLGTCGKCFEQANTQMTV